MTNGPQREKTFQRSGIFSLADRQKVLAKEIEQSSIFGKRVRGSNSAAHTQLVKDILETCAAYGVFAWPTKTGAGWVKGAQGKMRPMKFGIKGQSDVLCLWQSPSGLFLPIWLEAKTGSGVQDEYQLSFQADVERRGMKYFLIRSARELDDIFQSFRKSR